MEIFLSNFSLKKSVCLFLDFFFLLQEFIILNFFFLCSGPHEIRIYSDKNEREFFNYFMLNVYDSSKLKINLLEEQAIVGKLFVFTSKYLFICFYFLFANYFVTTGAWGDLGLFTSTDRLYFFKENYCYLIWIKYFRIINIQFFFTKY